MDTFCFLRKPTKIKIAKIERGRVSVVTLRKRALVTLFLTVHQSESKPATAPLPHHTHTYTQH